MRDGYISNMLYIQDYIFPLVFVSVHVHLFQPRRYLNTPGSIQPLLQLSQGTNIQHQTQPDRYSIMAEWTD